jgi:hypothetical protein
MRRRVYEWRWWLVLLVVVLLVVYWLTLVLGTGHIGRILSVVGTAVPS